MTLPGTAGQGRVWNRIASEVQDQIVEMALEQSDLSPRELAVRFTDEKRYFVSEHHGKSALACGSIVGTLGRIMRQ